MTMDNEQFTQLFNELMLKIGDGPGSHLLALSQIVESHTTIQETQKTVAHVNESIEAIRLLLKYLIFDLEATRRERDQLQMKLEDQE